MNLLADSMVAFGYALIVMAVTTPAQFGAASLIVSSIDIGVLVYNHAP